MSSRHPVTLILALLLAVSGPLAAATTSRTYAYPSPARNTCVYLTYQLPQAGHVDLRVYNERGNLVARLQEEALPGWQVKDLGLCRLPSGIYLHQVIIRYPSGETEILKGEPFAVLH
jgi:hypothetical protein